MGINLSHPSKKIHTKIHLPSSKSESNRALIINALSGNIANIQNVSSARDTVTMNRLLHSRDKILDVIDAGTTMRFLTAYLSLQDEERIITGTERMCERPIGLLVDALREIGAEIDYVKNDGYPPLKIKPFYGQKNNRIKIRGDVSSQYISALLLIAPNLPEGLTIEMIGEVGSRPYISMTLEMMAEFGIKYEFLENTISVGPQEYQPASFFVESDWSGASYWFSIASIAEEAEIELVGLKKNSLQGDASISKMMESLGITTEFVENAILLSKSKVAGNKVEFDFTHCPDIAQTIAVICAAKGIHLIMKGVESLKIKETDRLAALKTELAKFNVEVNDLGNYTYEVKGMASVKNQVVSTYKDHRMAMAFAPFALLGNVQIENPDVVVKSYPSFWDDLKIAGFIQKN